MEQASETNPKCALHFQRQLGNQLCIECILVTNLKCQHHLKTATHNNGTMTSNIST